MASFSKVKVGDKVDALFCGSATLGNAPYTDEGADLSAQLPRAFATRRGFPRH